ncbi:hypothetical protein M422DRAFT_257463 [Sphaerobolus stellatus SS14]|uniref:Uncharacterized protein n=1 Tax=Sphaerobolus stellatus (strain SS14) TaxID=990650 RepID=A0A0C9VNJ4_SPHS4|nr:hypothetical protein M422DRAFT_257463 [Sphaerobolus stellatus SS14]
MLIQAEYDTLFQHLSSLPSSLPNRPSTSNLPPQIDLEFTAEEGAWPAFNKVMHVTFSEFDHDLCSQTLSSEHNFTHVFDVWNGMDVLLEWMDDDDDDTRSSCLLKAMRVVDAEMPAIAGKVTEKRNIAVGNE